MSIAYCVIMHIKQKEILAESSKGKKYMMEIKSLYSEIFSSSSSDQLSIDNKNNFTYKKYKESVILVVSSKSQNKAEPFLFIEELKKNIEREYQSIKALLTKINNNITENCLEEKLGKIIDDTIKLSNNQFPESLKTIAELNKDVEGIKEVMNENVLKQIQNLKDLENPLLKAEELKNLAKEYRYNAKETLDKTRCWCSKKMKIFYVVFLALICLFLIYMVIALVRCGTLNAFCAPKV